jgi:hypothetical protein
MSLKLLSFDYMPERMLKRKQNLCYFYMAVTITDILITQVAETKIFLLNESISGNVPIFYLLQLSFSG